MGSGTITPIPLPPAPLTPIYSGGAEMPLLFLESWRNIIGYHPYHFWGLSNYLTPITSACNSLVKQYGWQSIDAAGRWDIREAILNGESKLLKQLGYSIAPHFVEKTLMFPHYPNVRVDQLGYAGADDRWISVNVQEKKLIQAGVMALAEIGTANVVYSDANGDGLNDTFTVSIPTSVTEADEIALYFVAADRLDSDPISDRWRIGPIKTTISGNVATIKGPSWILVKPILYEGVSTNTLDPTDASNFVTQVMVYQRYCNPTGTTNDTAQALLIWETPPYPDWCTCGCSGTTPFSASDDIADPAALGYALARVTIRDGENGIVGVGEAVYNTTDSKWYAVRWGYTRPPDRIIIRYYAGYPLVNGAIAQNMMRLSTWIGSAELNRRICACDNANRELFRWQEDLAAPGVDGMSYNITQDDLNNPFGTKRGHIEAWRLVRNERILDGFAV